MYPAFLSERVMPLKTPARGVSQEEAESIAVKALVWLATDFERLGRFLGETGLSPETVRSAASDPAFLPSVMDYLARNETILTEFASEHGFDPAQVVLAHSRLAGRPEQF